MKINEDMILAIMFLIMISVVLMKYLDENYFRNTPEKIFESNILIWWATQGANIYNLVRIRIYNLWQHKWKVKTYAKNKIIIAIKF